MLAGWDAEQMLGAVDGVAQLAIASGEDLGAVADIVTNWRWSVIRKLIAKSIEQKR